MELSAFPGFLFIVFDRFTVLAVFFTVFALAVDFMKRRKKCRNYPPGPWGLPFIGNIHQVDLNNPHPSFAKLWKKYGDVVGVQFGWTNTVILNGYETLKEALVKKSEDFADRPHLPMYQYMMKTAGDGIAFAKYGQWWKEQRRFAILTLRNFGVGKKSSEMRIVEEAGFLNKELEDQKGLPFDPNFLLTCATSNIICSTVFGERFEYNDKKFLALLHVLEESFLLEGAIWGQMKHIPKTSFLESKMIGTILNLFAGGTETSSTTLRWALLYMMIHPNLQSKVHDEIDRVIGKERKPTLEDREEMPYTNAVIHETQRFGNVAPLSLPHQTYRDTEIMGYTIPKGTMIIPNLTSAMFDENIWSTPHQFNPGHFLNPEGQLVKQEAFIPFSAGRRVCPGEQLARAELFLFFTSMLQRFTFHLPVNEPTPSYTEAKFGITLTPLPYRLCAKLR
ncbi:cytochrome P450 2D27-like isoform X3 [Scyliorhinus canicula]|uniref:cytochrome P450 2D27-like isoform X3 n=1 Tax=Scyliorhinus canicula TaxID=7830 RepID=UPI0018F43E6F|nr:cytochrome P450 2D27-like isoform X3 [Scyliorhinus canicula]